MNRAPSTRKRRRKHAALRMSAVVVTTAALAASGAMAEPATAATGGTAPVPAQPAGSAIATGHGIRVGTVKITTRLRNGRYELTDPTRGGLTIKDYLNNEYFGDLELSKPFTGKDNVWGNGTTSSRESAAVDAHFAAEQAWDYFKHTFHRLGPRGDNKGPILYVHFKKNFSHAQAIEDPMAALFGDGKNNKKPVTSLDAVAHEYTHLVSDATAKFGYSSESDALNEATSDIFAAMVEFQANLPSDPPDYLFEEQVYGKSAPVRYMDKPSRDGKSPDFWKPGMASGKDGDTHFQAGIANHFFYLLAEGSGKKTINGVAYNSPTIDGRKVAGIGRTKAARIWYEALTTQFHSTTGFKQARTGTLKAAAKLYGTSSREYAAVQKAWSAVNVK
ncbi:M4 family metallopeptidase [Streptomyces sioyaensis]|uniref:Neutral metalloproteinase n=1 Tax=Streptomyces sioyaensis TaxID=67364 RepID=A0A4Q1R282_9ACTN|nr:M4 family metallopeptidase [Streptomyces sioyaensis]MBM4796001.1 M4 family metallopeptidase [Streptomyces sioyaensis]RXS65349.1 M4 family peptidase [Streptomyces sioyaensis]